MVSKAIAKSIFYIIPAYEHIAPEYRLRNVAKENGLIINTTLIKFMNFEQTLPYQCSIYNIFYKTKYLSLAYRYKQY